MHLFGLMGMIACFLLQPVNTYMEMRQLSQREADALDYADKTSTFMLNDNAVQEIRNMLVLPKDAMPFTLHIADDNSKKGYISLCGRKIYFELTPAVYKAVGLYWLGRNDDGNLYVREKDIREACRSNSPMQRNLFQLT